MLPAQLVSKLSGVTEFVNKRIEPAGAWSSGIFSSFTGLFSSSVSSPTEDALALKAFGVDDKTAKAIVKLQTSYLSLEGLKGADDDALLCLNKGDGVNLWGIPEDFAVFVDDFTTREKDRRHRQPLSPKLSVTFFFAESDMLIGKGGQRYIERCWGQSKVAEVIDVSFSTKEGTSHDSVVLDMEKGALLEVFRKVSSLHRSSQGDTSAEGQAH